MLETFTMSPEPRSSMWGSSVMAMRMGEVKFVRIVVSRSASVSVWTSFRLPIAALFTRTST